jgi:hypothetical protein
LFGHSKVPRLAGVDQSSLAMVNCITRLFEVSETMANCVLTAMPKGFCKPACRSTTVATERVVKSNDRMAWLPWSAIYAFLMESGAIAIPAGYLNFAACPTPSLKAPSPGPR